MKKNHKGFEEILKTSFVFFQIYQIFKTFFKFRGKCCSVRRGMSGASRFEEDTFLMKNLWKKHGLPEPYKWGTRFKRMHLRDG
jgi:hypothetical protein